MPNSLNTQQMIVIGGDGGNGKGKNRLGQLLVELREKFKTEE